MTTVFGSLFLLLNQIQSIPSNGAKIITNNELAELFTPFGSNFNPSTVLSRLFAAKRLSHPPLCSKNAQKKIEKMIKTKAAQIFFRSAELNFVIS